MKSFLPSLSVALLGFACSAHRPLSSPPPATAEAALDLGAAIAIAEDVRDAGAPVFARALASADAKLRQRAVLALGRIQSQDSATELARVATEDGDPDVRSAALFAIGQLGFAEGVTVPEPAVAAVRGALAAGDIRLVLAATEALGKLAPSGAAVDLTPLLRHDDERVRAEAATALFRLRFAPVWRKEVKEAPALDDAVTASLAAALDDSSPSVRISAAHAFSRRGEARAVAQLVKASVDPEELVRLFAVRALGKSKTPSVATAVAKSLADASDAVRTEAVIALTTLGAVDLVPTNDVGGSAHYRIATARAFAVSARPESLAALRRLLARGTPAVVAAAIEAWVQRTASEERVRGQVSLYLASESWQIRAAAARACRHLGEGGLALLEIALADADMRVRSAGLEALSELVTLPIDTLLDRALDTPDLAVRGAAIDILAKRDRPDKLARLAAVYDGASGTDMDEIRESIADTAAELPHTEDLLRRMVATDPTTAVRSRARAALAKKGIAVDPEPAVAAVPSPFLGRHFDRNPVVVLETSKGPIEIECLREAAPIHVAAFVERVRAGFYDGLPWHRVVPSFVIQGGDPRGDGWGGPGYTVRDEISRVRFAAGTVAMPKGAKDTGGCQIFITHIPTPHLDGNYTIFGQVLSGLEVVKAIEIGDSIVRATVRE